MEVQHSSLSPLVRGRGRARGRARVRAGDSGDTPRPGLDSNSNKIQHGLDTGLNGQMTQSTNNPSHPQQEEMWSDAPAENTAPEENAANNRPPQRSRKYKFDSSVMSLIHRQLGQAREERRSNGQTKSQDRERPVSSQTRPQDRLKYTPRGDTDRPRSGTFPLAADSPVSHRVLSDGPPPDPPYRGMHDNRTEFRPHGHDKGRGRGRARGRARHTDMNTQTQRPGSGSSSPVEFPPHSAPHNVPGQFENVGEECGGRALENDLKTLTITVSASNDGMRVSSVNPHSPKSFSTQGRAGHSENEWVPPGVEADVKRSRSAKSPSQESGLGLDDFGVSSSGSAEHMSSNSEQFNPDEQNANRSSPHGIPSAHSARMSPLTLQIPDRPSPTVPTTEKENSTAGENDAQSPDFLKTPPGYQKVLDWAAEVCSPTSPIDMPQWT